MELNIDQIWPAIYTNASFLLLYVVMMMLGKLIKDRFTPFEIDDEIVEQQNLALATSYFGYTLGLSAIFIGAVLGPSDGLLNDLVKVGGYTLLGIILLNAARLINNHFILYKFNNFKEIIEDQNEGTGAVQGASYIASGLIVAASIHGEGGGIETAVALFAICQLAMILMTFVYDKITPFDVHDEIEKDNVAAGLAFSGSLIGIAIILAKGAAGDFVDWPSHLVAMFSYCVVAFVTLPIFRLVLDKVLIWGIDLNKAISEDQNTGAGLLEFGSTLGFSLVLYVLL